MFYLIKVDEINKSTNMIGEFDNKALSLECLYIQLQKEEKDKQIVIERTEDGGKACIYLKGYIYGKQLINYYQIIEYTDVCLFKKELDKTPKLMKEK